MSAQGQAGRATDLYRELQTRDSLLFNIGFNTCDLRPFENLVGSQFEFYHDQGGVTASKAAFLTSIQKGICSLDYKPRRELVPGSLQVYPLHNDGQLYGAIQTGEHRFYALEAGKPERLTSVAKFTHLWLLEKGQWQLSRGLSYDHQEPQASIAPDVTDQSRLFIDRHATESWLAQKHIPALGIGHLKNGKLKSVRMYGELQTGRPAPANAIFKVASLTKPVTAWLVLRLVSAGRWNLDEPLSRYFTDADVASDARAQLLTTRHVLSQQSGLPNWRPRNPAGKLAFEFAPGTQYQYSGEGFEYLRQALERKFGKSLDQLAAEWVFRPLKMKDTHFYWTAAVDEARFAPGHDAQGQRHVLDKHTTPNAAANLLTTVEDYGRFMQAAMKGTGLSKAVYRDMVRHQVQTKANKHFGLGWEMYQLANGEDALAHGGIDPGVRTQVFMLPKTREGLIIFTNGDNGVETFEPLLQHYLGEKGQQIIAIETKE